MHYKMLRSALQGKKISFSVTLAYEYYNSSFLSTFSELRQSSPQYLESHSVNLSYENAYSVLECLIRKTIMGSL